MPRTISMFDESPDDVRALLDLVPRLDNPFVLLREDAIRAITGLSDAQRHRLRKAGEFPDPVLIGRRAVAWRGSDIAAWLRSREPSKIADTQEAA